MADIKWKTAGLVVPMLSKESPSEIFGLTEMSPPTPIYIPSDISIQKEDKGRIRIKVILQRTGPSCNCSDCVDPVETEHAVAKRVWGIDLKLTLSQQAADFYLLYDLSLDDKDQGLFQEKIDYLVTQFKAYTDMAIGGELRHLPSRRQGEIPIRLQEPLMQKLSRSGGRGRAWEGWKDLRDRHGVDLLNDAIDGFHAFEGGGFGGAMWANIARTLEQLERKEITPLMFIDLCWGMEHNSGSYFSKVWTDGHLQKVLNANLYWNVEVLYKYAANDVSVLHRKENQNG